MLIGKATIEHFEECLKKGFCIEHKKELEGIDLGNHEAQRKAILFLRLQVFSPLLFHKPFTFEKMKVLFQEHSFYGKSENPESDPEFLENIIYLDAIIVYTICHFSKICCPGILFKQKADLSVQCTDRHLLDILQKKDINAREIGYLVPLFKENFEGKRENLYKLGYVATMLLVRNLSSRIELKSALEKLDKELNNIPTECRKWLDTGLSAQSQCQYQEAIKAYSCGLKYSSYASNLLHDRANMYLEINKFKEAALDSYRVLMIQPRSKNVEALYNLSKALHGMCLLDECLSFLEYALQICDDSDHRECLEGLKRMTEGIRMVKMANRNAREAAAMNENLSNGLGETGKITSNGCKAAAEEKKDIPELVEASDSESDEEDVPDLMEASNSDDSSSDSEFNEVDTDDDSTTAEKIDVWPSLTSGAINRIMNFEDVPSPVLQILGCETTPGIGCYRYKLFISDGVTSCPYAVLESEPDLSVASKEFEKYTIVRVDKCVCKEVQPNCRVIVLAKVKVLVPGNEVKEILGTPVNYVTMAESSSTPTNSEPVTPTEPVANSHSHALRESEPQSMNSEHSATSVPMMQSDSIDNVDGEAKIRKIKRLLMEASQSLLNGAPSALQRYREALDEIKTNPKEHEYTESDIVCVKYAFGISYYKSGEYDDLQKAISTFKGITEDHSLITFPAVYYGIALANRKLNRFKDALHYLQIVDDILQGSILSRDYTWPESSVIIEESNPEKLKSLVADLVSDCENPPIPEATCRFRDCAFQPSIYYSDPDFKGFLAIQCSSHCTLQYHPNCWKLLKTEKHFSDKEFLDQNCLTPDCEGLITKIQIIDKDGEIKRVFESAESKKSIKKKTRLEKKLEVKEEKRRKRKDSSSRSEATSEGTNDPETETAKDNAHSLEDHGNKGDAKTEVKDHIDGQSSSKETPIYPQTFTIIKKEKIVDENVTKMSSKVKEHKKTRNTISIDEFLDNHDTSSSANDYQQRISSLQQIKENTVNKQKSNIVLKPTAPAFEPQKTNFAQNQTAYGLDDFPQMRTPATPVSTSATQYDANVAGTTEKKSPAFSPAMLLPPEFSVECAKKNIYSYLKNILYKHGPLKEDDPILVQELQGFPGEANALIADCGGLGKFLQQSVDFAFVGDEYVCTVDQIAKAYYKKSSADIPLILKDFSPMDGYRSDSDMVDFTGYSDSYLNPDAQEQVIIKNSPHLMLAISKLRQPLLVDDESSKPPDNSFCKDKNGSRDSSAAQNSFNCSSSLEGELRQKLPTKLQLAHKCADAVKGYFSADASNYRSFIRQFIQPYAIVEAIKKSNVLVQTDNNEIETLLKNARKTDEELQRLREVVNCLTEQNVSLKEQNELLGEQCTLALDNVTKCQKKSSVELLSLRKELEDANLALEEQTKIFKSKESRLEKEIKGLSETLKKNKDEESASLSNLQADNKNLKSNLTQAEDRINLLLNEKHIIKTTLDLQINKLKENVQNLETDKAKALKRAESAELKLLNVQKISYLKIIDGKAADAVKRMKELDNGIAISKSSLNQVYATNFKTLLIQIQGYISKLAVIRTEFIGKIDDQINSVKNGMPLEGLKHLEMTELPEIPSWTNLQSMQNGTIPSAQAQLLNLNPIQMLLGQMPAGNAYFNAPINAQPQMPIGTPPRQPAYPYSSSTNQGTIPQTTAVPQTKKLPPGLADPKTEPVKATETVTQAVPKKQQASAVPQAVVKEGAGAKPKASSSGAKSLGASTLSMASGVSKSSLDLKKSCDSLELDYNVKKTQAKTVKLPEPAATAASTSSKSSSSKKSYEKLMARLRVIYPEATQAQITAMVKDFRSEKSSLSGLTIDMIINQIVAMVEAKKKEDNRRTAELAQKIRKIPNKPLVNKKFGASEDAAKEAEMNAKRGGCAWGVSGDSSKQWHGKDVDEPCTICFEEMTPSTAYKVDCGHTFHRTCIQEWINKKSDCPICRVHLLLPEDYPAL